VARAAPSQRPHQTPEPRMCFDGMRLVLFVSLMVLASSLTFPSFSTQYGTQMFQGQNTQHPEGFSSTPLRLDDMFFDRVAKAYREPSVPSPLYQDIPRKRSNTPTWGAWCSPSNSQITEHQDTALNCEVLAPVGSRITWSKNNNPIPSLTDVAPPSNALRPRSQRNVGDGQSQHQLRGRAHYKTELLLPCVDASDVGIYKINVQTQDGVSSQRIFNVSLAGQRDTPGMSCNLVEDFLSMPHIMVAAAT
ncbi:unnamed protein product, partial [Meganyctiphanes norvegica]